MTALLAILGLTVACALWVLVQRQADRVLPGNPGVVRDCQGCPQPPETCGPQEAPLSRTCAPPPPAEPGWSPAVPGPSAPPGEPDSRHHCRGTS